MENNLLEYTIVVIQFNPYILIDAPFAYNMVVFKVDMLDLKMQAKKQE
jgi:hypothetical protein